MPTRSCPDCGTAVRAAATACPACGRALPVEDGSHAAASADARRDAPGEAARYVYCTACGEEVLTEAELCPHCGVRRREPPDQRKEPLVALVLSFFLAGAGQVYNGDVAKGVVLMVAEVALLAIVFVGIFFLIGLLFLPLWLGVWGYAMYDAYVTAAQSGGDAVPS